MKIVVEERCLLRCLQPYSMCLKAQITQAVCAYTNTFEIFNEPMFEDLDSAGSQGSASIVHVRSSHLTVVLADARIDLCIAWYCLWPGCPSVHHTHTGIHKSYTYMHKHADITQANKTRVRVRVICSLVSTINAWQLTAQHIWTVLNHCILMRLQDLTCTWWWTHCLSLT